MLVMKALLNVTRSIEISCMLNTFIGIKRGWPIASSRRIKMDLIIFVGIKRSTTRVLLMQFCRKAIYSILEVLFYNYFPLSLPIIVIDAMVCLFWPNGISSNHTFFTQHCCLLMLLLCWPLHPCNHNFEIWLQTHFEHNNFKKKCGWYV
jgi:hypothetical protein